MECGMVVGVSKIRIPRKGKSPPSGNFIISAGLSYTAQYRVQYTNIPSRDVGV